MSCNVFTVEEEPKKHLILLLVLLRTPCKLYYLLNTGWPAGKRAIHIHELSVVNEVCSLSEEANQKPFSRTVPALIYTMTP